MRVKNNKQSADTWAGLELQPGQEYDLQPNEITKWQAESKVIEDLVSLELLIGDGVDYKSDPASAVALLLGVDAWPKTGVLNIPKVAIMEPDGQSFYSRVTHDFGDRCSWYQESTRLIDQPLVLLSGLTYSTGDAEHTNWIDVNHGRITGEINLRTQHSVVVKSNNVELAEDADFIVNYEAGEVTFLSAPTNPTVTFSLANGSCWTLRPDAGKMLFIKHAEVQFSKDVLMQPIFFEVWAYNPYDLPNKVMIERVEYNSERDVLNIANLGYVIPSFGSLQHDTLVFPFNYPRLIILNSSQGTEIRIKTKNDAPFSQGWATITIYTVEDDE